MSERKEKRGQQDGRKAAQAMGLDCPERRRLITWLGTQEPDTIAVMTAEHNTRDAAYTPAEQVFFAIHPGQDGERPPAADYWDGVMEAIGESPALINNPDYFRGFIRGYVGDE